MAGSQCVLSTHAFLKPVLLQFSARQPPSRAPCNGLGGPAPQVSHPGLLGRADFAAPKSSQVILMRLDRGAAQTLL